MCFIVPKFLFISSSLLITYLLFLTLRCTYFLIPLCVVMYYHCQSTQLYACCSKFYYDFYVPLLKPNVDYISSHHVSELFTFIYLVEMYL